MNPKAKAELVKNMIRSTFAAPKGKKFFVADFASIEDRVGMWYAKEEGMLQAFRDGVDAYLLMAEVIFGHPCTKKDKKERNVGKVTRLGALYGMGVPTFSATYDWALESEEQAKKCIKLYRESTPGVPAAWRQVGHAFKIAMNGQEEVWNGVVLRKETVAGHDCVTAELPSGRKLFYYEPKIEMEYNNHFDCFMPQLHVKIKVQGKMFYRRTWGGDIFQDIVQATARDLCMYGTTEVKKLGFTPCISVHDEIVSLGDEDREVSEYEQAFQKVPEWAAEIPVAAEGWKGLWYRKD